MTSSHYENAESSHYILIKQIMECSLITPHCISRENNIGSEFCVCNFQKYNFGQQEKNSFDL